MSIKVSVAHTSGDVMCARSYDSLTAEGDIMVGDGKREKRSTMKISNRRVNNNALTGFARSMLNDALRTVNLLTEREEGGLDDQVRLCWIDMEAWIGFSAGGARVFCSGTRVLARACAPDDARVQ